MTKTAAQPAAGQVSSTDLAAELKEPSVQQVVQSYKNMVYSIALTHSQNRADADDVFQEVFLVYQRKQPSFASEERRKAWLIVTTINCARQLTGSSWARKVIPLNELDELHTAGQGSHQDDFCFASDEQNLIYQALKSLAPSYRSVLQLFYFEDLSVAQIAQVLELSAGTVRVQLSRARAQVKDLLKGDYFNE